MIQFVFLLALATAKPIEDNGYAFKYFGHQPNFYYHNQPAVSFNAIPAAQSFVSYKTNPSFYSAFGAVGNNNFAHVSAPVVNVRTASVPFASHPRPVVNSLLTPVVKASNHFVHVARKPQVEVKSFGLPPVQLTPIKVSDDSAEINSVAFAHVQKQPQVAPAVVTYNAPTPVYRGINFPVVKPVERPTYYSHVTVSDEDDDDDDTVTYYHSRDGQTPSVSVYSTNDNDDNDDDDDVFRYHSPSVASFRSAVGNNPHNVVYRTDDDDDDDDHVFRYHSPSRASFRSSVTNNPHTVVYGTDDDDDDDDDHVFRYHSPSRASFRSSVPNNPHTVVYRTDDDDDDDDDDHVFRYHSASGASFRSSVSNNPHTVVYSTNDNDDDDDDDDTYFRSAFGSSFEIDDDKRKKRSTDDVGDDNNDSNDDDNNDVKVVLKSGHIATASVEDYDDDDDNDVKVVLKSGRSAKTFSFDDDDDDDDVKVVLKSGRIATFSVEDHDDDDDNKHY